MNLLSVEKNNKHACLSKHGKSKSSVLKQLIFNSICKDTLHIVGLTIGPLEQTSERASFSGLWSQFRSSRWTSTGKAGSRKKPTAIAFSSSSRIKARMQQRIPPEIAPMKSSSSAK